MKKAVRTRIFGHACICTKWLRNDGTKLFLPICPLILLICIYIVISLCPIAGNWIPEPEQGFFGEQARLGISIATILLGMVAATVLMLKRGTTPEERREEIKQILNEDVPPSLQVQFGNEKTTLEDFIQTNNQDLAIIWEAVDQINRYFYFTNIVVSLCIGVFAITIYFSYLLESVALWAKSMDLLLSLCILLSIHLIIALVPSILDKVILFRMRGDTPRLCYQEFRAEFKEFTKFIPPISLTDDRASD